MKKEVKEKALAEMQKIFDAMNTICELCDNDDDLYNAVPDFYPFHLSLEEIASDVWVWREVLSEK